MTNDATTSGTKKLYLDLDRAQRQIQSRMRSIELKHLDAAELSRLKRALSDAMAAALSLEQELTAELNRRETVSPEENKNEGN